MTNTGRKHEAVDLIKLYAECDSGKWNAFLTKHAQSGNINELGRMLYGIQAGIVDLENKKMNTEKLTIWYCRLVGSLKRTIMDVMKSKQGKTLQSKKTMKKSDITASREAADDFKKMCF